MDQDEGNIDQWKLIFRNKFSKGKTNMHRESSKQRPLMGKNKKTDATLVKGEWKTKPTLVQANIS